MAKDIESELNTASPDFTSKRLRGNIILSIAGKSEENLMHEITLAKKALEPHIELVLPTAQSLLHYNMLPISKRTNYDIYKHQLPLSTLSGMLPNLGSRVSHEKGVYLGRSHYPQRTSILWDIWRSQKDQKRSGFTMICGNLGSGKSALASSIALQSILNGDRWIILDPYGHMSKLSKLPLLKDREINTFTLSNMKSGFLDPFFNFSGDELDNVIYEFLRNFYQHIGYEELSERILLDFILYNTPRVRSFSEFLEVMNAHQTPEISSLARSILRMRNNPYFQQWIGEGGRTREESVFSEINKYQVNIFSFEELIFKQSEFRKDIDSCVLDLTYRHVLDFIAKSLFSIDANSKNSRKAVLIDEAHGLLNTESGSKLLKWIARDSRKQNIRALCVTQNLSDLSGFLAFIDYLFVGQLTDEKEMQLAAEFCKLSTPSLFDRLSRSRSSRDFVLNNRMGHTEVVNIDLSYNMELLKIFE
jgi:hypothetical protein